MSRSSSIYDTAFWLYGVDSLIWFYTLEACREGVPSVNNGRVAGARALPLIEQVEGIVGAPFLFER